MNIDVLMHAALRRLGPMQLGWVRASGSFIASWDEDGTLRTVSSPSWAELWQRVILEAVARR